MLVRADAGVLGDAAARLRRASALAGLAGVHAGSVDWSGPAASAAQAAGVECTDAAQRVSAVSGAAAAVLAELASRVGELAAREAALHRADRDVVEANTRWVAGGSLGTDPAGVLLGGLRGRQAVLAADYEDASYRAAARLDALRIQIEGRPLQVRDQVEGFLGSVEAEVAGSVALAWGLTGDVVLDRDRWWGTVRATAGGVVDMVRDPVGVLKDSVGWDDFGHGRYGAGLGTLALTAAMRKPSMHQLLSSADAPRTATLDEAAAGVRLDDHELGDLGHVLSRHVEVDDQYLVDRIRLGTLMANGKRRPFSAEAASRFTDRLTAEVAITLAVRREMATLRRELFDEGGDLSRLEIADLGIGPIGVSILRSKPDDGPKPRNGIVVVVRRVGERIMIVTAHPK